MGRRVWQPFLFSPKLFFTLQASIPTENEFQPIGFPF